MGDPDASSSAPGSRHQNCLAPQEPQPNLNRKKPSVRKRTKTGCLTCRRRRIKCDEGRPVCNNCIKSKRDCDGYNQRLVFKSPYANLDDAYGPPYYPTDPSDSTGQPNVHAGVAGSTAQGAFPAIAPKPPFGSQHYHQPHHQHPSLPFLQQASGVQQPGELSHLTTNQGHGAFHHGPYHSLPPNPLLSSAIDSAHASLGHPALARFEYHAVEPARSPYASAAERPAGQLLLASLGTVTGPSRALHTPWEEDIGDDEHSIAASDDDDLDPNLMLPLVSQLDMVGTEVRAFSAFAQSNIVSEYMHYPYATELKDSGMRFVFLHFVRVTGPSMSLYERHPFGHAGVEQSRPKRESGSNMWSYTFPVLSLHHPGLLNAMLAIGSLQISKIQGNPSTAALKHYHLALRRVAKNLKSPSRRVHLATLAATLLLAYFEVWSSDHSKWCNHLFGARILFREMPLRKMTRVILPFKRIRDAQERQEYADPLAFSLSSPPMDDQCDKNDINLNLLYIITGTHIPPEDYGLEEDYAYSEEVFSLTDRDIEKYENLRDLFWWYCKMDVYQSILGGTRLFMGYEHWTQCPPRAAVNNIETIYGTYDHLMLLLGRLANFASRDVARKRKLNQTQESASGSSQPPNASPPLFPGMIPTPGVVKVPMGFSPPRHAPSQPEPDEPDPFATTQAALQEWDDIRLAFEALESHFGPAFQPLRPEYMDHRDTPFGGLLQFRTYAVAGIWMNYYMGLIVLHRCHPSMPPAAMQAAGIAAHKTAHYANQIGRIAAGLTDDRPANYQISTLLSAAFIESSFCLFVAGVQFNDNAQRRWVVQRMLDIAHLTGWQSARQIANGCESCWVKAHKMGRGPPYELRAQINDSPSSVWQNPRRLDQRLHELGPEEEKQLVLTKSEQTHFALGLLGVEEDLRILKLREYD